MSEQGVCSTVVFSLKLDLCLFWLSSIAAAALDQRCFSTEIMYNGEALKAGHREKDTACN